MFMNCKYYHLALQAALVQNNVRDHSKGYEEVKLHIYSPSTIRKVTIALSWLGILRSVLSVVLDPEHQIKLLIKEFDEKLLHPGLERVFSELCRHYWIL